MLLYGGIDLHANNRVVVLLNEQDQGIYQRRFSNYRPEILVPLAPYQADIQGVVVESTSNWYGLVDGLMEAGSRVQLANPGALQPYSSLQYPDDHSDARWLAHVLRLGGLPAGYIDPKAERAVWDGWRKRAHVVRQQTATGLSLQNIIVRNTGVRLSAKRMHALVLEEIERRLPEPAHVLAVTSSLAVVPCLGPQIHTMEKLGPTHLQPPRLCAAADRRGHRDDCDPDDWAGAGR